MSTEQQAKPDLTWDEALDLAKTDARELAARLRGDKVLVPAASLWPSTHAVQVRTLWWRWWITDPGTGDTLACGHSLRGTWARHRAYVAAAKAYGVRSAARRAES